MAEKVGTSVVNILEQAGERYLAFAVPDEYGVFLTQVGAAGTLRDYDGSEVYWRRVQTVLDFFFTSAQRADIYDRLVATNESHAGPEFRGFLASAVAERRLQELIATTRVRSSAPGG